MTAQSRNEDRVCGIHSALAVLEQSPDRIQKVLFAQKYRGKRLHAVRMRARDQGIRVEDVPKVTLDRLAAGERHQGVVVVCQQISPHTEREFEEAFFGWSEPLLLVCEGVQDPRNLGSCLRTADAAGVDAVLFARNRSAPLTHVVHRASAGALEALYMVEVANIARRLDWLKQQGVVVVGTSDAADLEHTAVDYRGPLAVVIGGEEKGLRRLSLEKCDYAVSISMHGQTPSLNVAVATGVVLFEAQRQRKPSSATE